MMKNRSLSLQKINPLKQPSSNIRQPRAQRLNFPKVGDSGFYGGVGKKHYDSSIKQLLLNIDYEGGLIKKRSNPQNEKYSYQKNGNSPITKSESNNFTQHDSLAKLEAQFEQKNIIKKQKPIDNGIFSQKIHRKNEISSPVKSESHHRLFGDISDLYNQVNRSQNKKNAQHLPRAFNPTNLSSKFVI